VKMNNDLRSVGVPAALVGVCYREDE